MKTSSCTRIFMLTFLFLSFSAVAKDSYAVSATGVGITNFISRPSTVHALGSPKNKSACDARACETKSTIATLCTRKYAGEKAD